MNEAVLQGRVRGVNRAHELANQLQGVRYTSGFL